jgi:hypothetical protein
MRRLSYITSKRDIHVNRAYFKFSFSLKESMTQLCYEDQPVDVFWEVISVCTGKHTNSLSLSEQSAELLTVSVVAYGICNYHCALKRQNLVIDQEVFIFLKVGWV